MKVTKTLSLHSLHGFSSCEAEEEATTYGLGDMHYLDFTFTVTHIFLLEIQCSGEVIRKKGVPARKTHFNSLHTKFMERMLNYVYWGTLHTTNTTNHCQHQYYHLLINVSIYSFIQNECTTWKKCKPIYFLTWNINLSRLDYIQFW